MESGDLKHVVDFQRRANQQDPVTGEVKVVWKDMFTTRAHIADASGREYVAAAAVQSDTLTRITVRQRRGLNAMEPKQRILHGTKCCQFLGKEFFNPEAMLRDKANGWEWVTIPCSRGTDQGG